MYRIACLFLLGTAFLVGTAARASDYIGGYLMVDKVILEPADSPTKIQIWGSFALASEPKGDNYNDPVRGYLYYQAPSGKEDVCRKEWSDMKKAAGTGQVIGFASRYDLKALGKVRKANEKPETPDTYPLANGLTKGADYDDQDYLPFSKLRSLPAPQIPAEGDLVPKGEITLVVRNIADKKRAKTKYVFELEGASGDKEEATIDAGDKETKWTPKLKLKGNDKYTWRVRAVEGDWKGPVATASFITKG
jgi:hypothetical protein